MASSLPPLVEVLLVSKSQDSGTRRPFTEKGLRSFLYLEFHRAFTPTGHKMDERIGRLVGMLKKMGYTDRYVAEHWDGGWRDKRWFDLSAPDSSILQIITADVYTRINLTDAASEQPFALIQYVSAGYPERPKTDFHHYPEVRRTMEQILRVVADLGNFDQVEAA